MQLYDHPDCPYGMKVRITLAETGCDDYEAIQVDLAAGQQRSPEFLKLNPFGQVPVLVDDDTVVYDSTIINEYLSEEYAADPGLFPDAEHAGERARVRLLEDYADRAFTPAARAIERELLKAGDLRDDARLEAWRETLAKGLEMLERELSERQFLGGGFSLADIAFAPVIMRLDALGVQVDASLGNVKEWINQLAGRPSIGSVLELVA